MEQLSKMRARCNTLGKILRVVFWLYLAILAAAFLYIGIRALLTPEAAFSIERYGNDTRIGFTNSTGDRGWSLTAHNVMIHLRETDSCKGTFGLIWLTSLGRASFIAVILWCLSAIFSRIQAEGVPFTPACCRLVRWIGLLLLAGFAYQTVVERGVVLLFGPPAGYSTWTGDLELMLLGGVVLCLSYVFEYGAVLQRESDETL